MKNLVNYFLQGLLFTIPIAATSYVLYSVFISVDGILPFNNLPGLGIVIIVAGITTLGYLSKFYFSNPISTLLEKGIERTPLVKLIYSSVKDLISAFVGEKKRFNHPVLVTINLNPLVQRVGFITQNDLTEMGIDKDKVAVYLPFSYGLNGELVIVAKNTIEPIDASGTEMMKFVISGGVSEV